MHLLNRLSSFVSSPDKKYIVFVNRLWDKESTKYYTNLKYIDSPFYNSNKEKNSVVPLNITIPELGLVDSVQYFLLNSLSIYSSLEQKMESQIFIILIFPQLKVPSQNN